VVDVLPTVYCLPSTVYRAVGANCFFYPPLYQTDTIGGANSPAKTNSSFILTCTMCVKTGPEIAGTFWLLPLTPSPAHPFSFPGSRPQRASHVFVFFTPSASNRYNRRCQFPSKNAPFVHSDMPYVRKNRSRNAFCPTCFRSPKPGSSAAVIDPQSQFDFQRSASPGARRSFAINCPLSLLSRRFSFWCR
jgi:hypothetical protein